MLQLFILNCLRYSKGSLQGDLTGQFYNPNNIVCILNSSWWILDFHLVDSFPLVDSGFSFVSFGFPLDTSGF